jgi:hypothetical protein
MQIPSGHIFILGLPLYAWLGMLTFVFLVTTAVLGMLVFKGKWDVPLDWHLSMARLTIVTAIVHGIVFVWATFF